MKGGKASPNTFFDFSESLSHLKKEKEKVP